jgi:hypothetical protein
MFTILYKVSDGVIIEGRHDASDVVATTEQLLSSFVKSNDYNLSDYACVEFPLERRSEVKPQKTLYIPATAEVVSNPNYVEPAVEEPSAPA